MCVVDNPFLRQFVEKVSRVSFALPHRTKLTEMVDKKLTEMVDKKLTEMVDKKLTEMVDKKYAESEEVKELVRSYTASYIPFLCVQKGSREGSHIGQRHVLTIIASLVNKGHAVWGSDRSCDHLGSQTSDKYQTQQAVAS